MYIIDREGKKYKFNTNDFRRISSVSCFDDDVYLEDAWILYFNKYNFDTNSYEFIGEKRYFHEPIDEEIMYEMGQRNMNHSDYVDISKIKVLSYEDT